jgi:transcriptional regulator with GAF, ATPase, and Fis domain
MKLTSLQAIMLSIAEAQSLDNILEQIVRGVVSEADIALARIWLIQPSADCPICAAGPLPSPDTPALHLRGSALISKSSGKITAAIGGGFHRLEIGQRKIGQIAQSGKPLMIPDITGEESWLADPAWIRREKILGFAGQPLIFKNETLGVLAVFSRSRFSREDAAWLRTFADYAAVAIANAKAFDQLDHLRRQLQAENEYLQGQLKAALQPSEIVGSSASLKKVLEQVALVASTKATVLIQGESGTGKELIARAIHGQSPRQNCPFVKVNCAAIPEGLFESEFFGHVKGAFTGAVRDRPGRFELAHTGDIFLDEIAEVPLAQQTKLLRVLQEKQFERVGEARTRSVDVRVIAATNRDLRAKVERGEFREDLFYRLSVFPIELPPLRERRDDIPLLALHFLQQSAAKLGLRAPQLTDENLRRLREYNWPGNIRELENVIERATILSRTSGKLNFDFALSASRKSLSGSSPLASSDPSTLLTREQLRQRELDNILAALDRANGKVFGPGGAAELLRMRPTTLASRMKALGLRKSFTPPSP